MKITIGAMTAFVFLLCQWGPSIADSAHPMQIRSLKGLQGVYILVESIKPEIEKLGLTQSKIKTDVELRLRKAGIKVLSKQDSFEAPGMPYLYIIANVLPHPSLGTVAYTVKVELCQEVILSRNNQDKGDASTWWTPGMLGLAGKNQFVRIIRDEVADQVDKFINDYLSLNPK